MKIVNLDPDVVTVYVGINDGIPVRSGTSDEERGRKSARVWDTRRFLSHSRFYQMLEYIVLRFFVRQDPLPMEFGNEVIKPYQANIPVRVTRKQYLKNMSAMRTICKSRGMTMLMLTSPSRGDDASQNGSNSFIRDVARYDLTPYIDLFTVMKPAEQAGVELFDSDGGHPNKAGHELIGKLLADWFAEHALSGNAKAAMEP